MKQLKYISLIAIALTAFACKPKQSEYETIKLQGFVQGSTYHITYMDSLGRDLHPEIKAELKKFDQSMSVFDSSSVISRINRNEDVQADSIFIEVFNKALEVSQKTDGAFDMTVGPLVRMWGFNNGKKITVTQAMVDSVKEFIGYQKVKLIGDSLVKEDPRISLDANAIAQGYSCDLIAKFLESKGIHNYMVEIGGEIMTRGESPRGDDWKIGINKPIDDSTSTISEIQEIVHIKNLGLNTSGNYRKFYMHNGKKYSHEIDPHTGYPVTHNLLSATIIAPDCMTADAYATACMVLGLEKSQALINSLPNIEGYFIYSTPDGNKEVWTKGFEKYLDK